MLLYHTRGGLVVEDDGAHHRVEGALADWISRSDLSTRLREGLSTADRLPTLDLQRDLLPPVDRQEVWAAGVTYFRSRDARMEESKATGGQDFYDRVYSADRPELFFKATPRRVVGHGGEIRIRHDSRWNVPEPELALVVSAEGAIVGYTIGNDVSSRDIEGENPLYLPQAKVYRQCCALGPGVLVSDGPLPETIEIAVRVTRDARVVFSGETRISAMKRRPEELVSWLMREDDHPDGVILLTGTGVVPDPSFTLLAKDEVTVMIDGLGALTNRVVQSESERA